MKPVSQKILVFFALLLFALMEGKSCLAQLPVRDEPSHHRVLENKWLRILDVRIEPGDTTLYHYHSTPSVIVFFTKTALGTRIQGESPVIGYTQIGGMTFAAFGERPVFHQVWNNDTSLFHVMDIELLGPTPEKDKPPFDEPGFFPDWQEKLVNTYRIPLKPSQTISKQPAENPLLLICFKGMGEFQLDADPHPISLTAGKYVWIERKKSFRLKDHSEKGSGYVLLELK